jgi:hypothetical protein
MRIETSTSLPKRSKSNDAFSENSSLTNLVRSIDPRQQQPYGGSGCSAQGLVASMFSQ